MKTSPQQITVFYKTTIFKNTEINYLMLLHLLYPMLVA